MLNKSKSGRIILNLANFSRQHVLMRVIHDKCGSVLVNAGDLVCMLKATFSTGLCCQKQTLNMINAM